MRSASREALAAAIGTLGEVSPEPSTAEELFAAARLLGESTPLRSFVTDATVPGGEKQKLVDRVFAGKVGAAAQSLLTAVVGGRWSRQDDVLAAIEELGIRAAAITSDTPGVIQSELFAFRTAVSSDPELELALRSKLADPASKARLAERLLEGKAHPGTLAIVRQLILQPRGRRVRDGVRAAAEIVADQAGSVIAVVTTAAPLDEKQLDVLVTVLAKRYGRAITVNCRVDPSILGGVRVEIGDDVIDGSIASRLADVRLQLAGR